MKKKFKNSSLFLALGGFILLYALFTYIIPVSGSFGVLDNMARSEVGIFRLLAVIFEAMGGFSGLIIFILLVGALYGILEATGVYEKLVENMAAKFSKHAKLFMAVTIIIIALISSICGLEMGMFFLFPIIIAVIVAMGYDKLTALACTFGATIVGMFGATFAGTLYNLSSSVVTSTIGSSITSKDLMILKVLLLVFGVTLLILFTIKNANKNANEERITYLEEASKADSNKKTWPILLIMGLVLLVLILGGLDFTTIFGNNLFVDLNTKFTEFKIFNYPIFDKLLGGFDPFGTWFNPTRFEYSSMVIVAATIILSIVYKIKFSDAADAYFDGMKKFFKPAVLASLACSVFVMVYYYPIAKTIGTYIMTATDNFNVGLGALYSLVEGVFYVDPYYYTYYGLPYLVTAAETVSLASLMNVVFISMYSLAMLVAPTSVMLMVSLSSSEVKYTSWLKYIWRLFVGLLVSALAVIVSYYILIMSDVDPIKAQWIIFAVALAILVITLVIIFFLKRSKKVAKVVKEEKTDNNVVVKEKPKKVPAKKTTKENKTTKSAETKKKSVSNKKTSSKK